MSDASTSSWSYRSLPQRATPTSDGQLTQAPMHQARRDAPGLDELIL